MVELFKKTVAYKIILGDKTRGQLSHAYALVCEDCFTLNAFIKIVAKMLLCDSADYCDQCRSCRLIEKGTHSDVTFYPKTAGGKINEKKIFRKRDIKKRISLFFVELIY